jgi:hypothetical protein
MRGMKPDIEAIKFEITVLAGKPTTLPYTNADGSAFHMLHQSNFSHHYFRP